MQLNIIDSDVNIGNMVKEKTALKFCVLKQSLRAGQMAHSLKAHIVLIED